MAHHNNNLIYQLFVRPNEPLFTNKNNGGPAFIVPNQHLLDERHAEAAGAAADVAARELPSELIYQLPAELSLPDLNFATAIDKAAPFSLFSVENAKIAGQLIKVFMEMGDLRTLIDTCAYSRDRINPYLYQYALSVAIAHRPDTKNMIVPSLVQTFPNQFLYSSVFQKAREEAALVTNPENRKMLEIPLNNTATDKETEQAMAYFREDIGVNLHHWHWHLVYPTSGPDEVVKKDRRGELFYYMHNQIIARYNVDRFAKGLAKVRPFSDFREPITEGYFPKLIRSSTNCAYPSRPANTMLSNVNRSNPKTVVEISHMELLRDRIYTAIDSGYVVDVRNV